MANDEKRRNKRLHKEKAAEALSIPQIFSATSKILENAQELIEDAELLLRNNRYPRAFALAHLASEELIKYQLLLSVTLELARDHPVDWMEIHRRLRGRLYPIARQKWKGRVSFFQKSALSA